MVPMYLAENGRVNTVRKGEGGTDGDAKDRNEYFTKKASRRA